MAAAELAANPTAGSKDPASEDPANEERRVWLSLAIAAAAGLALIWLFPDSYQQDAGHHYLSARWAWTHPSYFVGVWNRPLFTLLYSIPAQLGYPAAKLLTLLIALITAHQTYRLARDLKIARAWLAVPLIVLQPAFFMISTDTLTEPLFALIFVVAIRLHTAGRVAAGAIVAASLILVRPEGFFLAALWALWIVSEARSSDPARRRTGVRSALRQIPLLAAGAVAWWLAALAITGDPLFILHNWPPNWGIGTAWYGIGPVWTYLARLPEIAGPLLLVPFLAGLWHLAMRRQLVTLTSSVLMLFVVHTLLRVSGWFGSAGYARYFVCVSPAIAIITLTGWHRLSSRFAHLTSGAGTCRTVGAMTLAISAVVCVFYADMGGFYGRDARAVADMYGWFRESPRPIARFIWSQAYMDVLFDRDPEERLQFTADRATNIELFRQLPAGTLVFWDGETGPSWHLVTADDLEAAGYERLRSQSYELDGWLKASRWLAPWSLRRQEMHLLYKSR